MQFGSCSCTKFLTNVHPVSEVIPCKNGCYFFMDLSYVFESFLSVKKSSRIFLLFFPHLFSLLRVFWGKIGFCIFIAFFFVGLLISICSLCWGGWVDATTEFDGCLGDAQSGLGEEIKMTYSNSVPVSCDERMLTHCQQVTKYHLCSMHMPSAHLQRESSFNTNDFSSLN